MKILVTGSKGMVGKALVKNLYNLKNKRIPSRMNISISDIYEYDIDSNISDLEYYCKNCDFVFHLAGVNRPIDNKEFMEGNFGFSNILLDMLKKYDNKSTLMLSSSIQATLKGRYLDSEYGKSKLAGEELFREYSIENNVRIAIYRFPNIMGHSKPDYNSAISTFCNAIANDLPFKVNDRKTELELIYIDDLIQGMYDLLEGKEKRCCYIDGLPIENMNGEFCFIPKTYKVQLGYIIDLLKSFKNQPRTLIIPSMREDSFEKKLYSLYLTYLPKESFKFDLKMNIDNRGSFTEILHSLDFGQVSVNISKPGITKGQHWHNSKWEIFIVVSGHGSIVQRNLDTNEVVEFQVTGDKIEAVYMIPGWSHKIINLSEEEDLITVMMCNEIFDSKNPDTFYEEV